MSRKPLKYYPFTYAQRDDLLEIEVARIACEVGFAIDTDDGEPKAVPSNVKIGGESLFIGEPLTRRIAAAILTAAEDDDALTSRAIQDWQNAYGKAA